MTEEKVALITGGTRGIGLGIAKMLARRGINLVVTGRRRASEIRVVIDELRAESSLSRPLVEYMRYDLAEVSSRLPFLADIEAQFGRLDVLINNAGIAPTVRADILEATEASFDEVVGTNLRGTYFLTQAVANWMIRQQNVERKHRCIINITSVSASAASINRGDYCLSKAGLAMSTKLWASRLTGHGIGVYEIRPGIIETDMTKGVKSKYDDLIEGGLLLEKRWGTAEDVGRVATMLVTGELPYAPGAVLLIDGGMTVPRL
jgi:NAD(P)-dependent dehydrogenase (short-subunit alcohol dehydrogenase family)